MVKLLQNPSLLLAIVYQNPELQPTTTLPGQCDITIVAAREMHAMEERSTPTNSHPVHDTSASTRTELEMATKITVSKELFQWQIMSY